MRAALTLVFAGLLGTVLICLLCAASAQAAPAGATPAGSADLTKIKAQRVVRDTILSTAPLVARASRAVARAAFTDSAGRTITIDSTVPTFDLNQVAAVLNSTYHFNEIAHVQIHVVTLADMAAICGDPQAVACYLPTDPLKNGDGQIWIAADDTDWQHSLVHEYGHHTDNQLLNLGQLHRWGIGRGCSFDGDGSREWFFARQLEDDILGAGFSCNAGNGWDHLLPELYAEDFVALNHIDGWQLTSAPAPTADQLRAMKWDIDNGLYIWAKRYTWRIARSRSHVKTIATPNISFLRVRTTGGRGSNFDIYVYVHGERRAIAHAKKRGRIDTLLGFIAPGRWDVRVVARGKSGKVRTEISLL